MIGSFWNLCRACPSMPVDKLHSEYRSTYRWHEYTGNSRPEVVRKPPVPNQFASSTEHFFSKSMEDEKSVEGPINEPPLPRRKKCPELAYRSHDFIGSDIAPTNLRNDVTRARSEERGTPSRRSKSEGPPGLPNGRAYPYESDVVAKTNGVVPTKAGESSGLFKKTITKLSTEYRIQFVWPHVRKAIKGETNNAVESPRKSLSMGAIRSSQKNAMPTVHKKRTANEKEAKAYELEPLVNDVEERKPVQRQAAGFSSSEQRSSNRPFSQMVDQDRANHFLTRKENFGFSDETVANAESKLVNGTTKYDKDWYKEVIELRKKAGEYKCRGWGVGVEPDLQKKQKDIWEQVSRRSSLSALSLASSVHRPITKEEKEQENNKKSSPTKHSTRGRVPGHSHLVDNKTVPDGPILPARVQSIRHHLERTTGPDVEEGALLPSPTREKLMPTIPKSKESEPYSSQRGSPKKSAASRHGSPQKGSPQKGSPKKAVKGRSQSVGPSAVDANESPKRQIRSVSQAPSAAATKNAKKTVTQTPTTGERRPRPSTLSTSIHHSRSKSSSLPPSGRVHSAPGSHHIQLSQNDTNKTTTASGPGSNQTHPIMRKTNKNSKQVRPQSALVNGPPAGKNAMTESTIFSDVQNVPKSLDNKKLAENDEENLEKDSSLSPHLIQHELTEHIVKSPPEPTRVKSPEQIIMRSPDPVNWTVPLDTGKTFTVTQNVKDGENFSRPQSEVKVSTPVERPPPAPQSAPPELAEQAKMEAWKNSESRNEKNVSDGPSPTGDTKKPLPEIRYDKPVPGSTLRVLDDPSFETDPVTIRSTAADVLEKARDRFDRFWGGTKEEEV